MFRRSSLNTLEKILEELFQFGVVSKWVERTGASVADVSREVWEGWRQLYAACTLLRYQCALHIFSHIVKFIWLKSLLQWNCVESRALHEIIAKGTYRNTWRFLPFFSFWSILLQCFGSVTFWYGFGSANPVLWLMDPDADPGGPRTYVSRGAGSGPRVHLYHPLWMRSSLVVRASDCQCTSCNGPGFDPSIRRHSGIWEAADEAVLNTVWKNNIYIILRR